MNKMQILKSGKNYNILGEVVILDKLEPINYEYAEGMYGPQLVEIDPIKLPSKIYSNDNVFIQHVNKAWELREGNIGVCLVGEKGLGKSLTASIIAKNAGIPVIRITSKLYNNAAFTFLNQIKQDFVLFIDEFEKLFDKKTDNEYGESKKDDAITQESFLSFLDGGSVRDNNILFIATSNSDWKISDFLKNRPSRFKYFRSYERMEDSVIKEIVEDLLEDKQFAEDLLQNIPYEGLNTDVLIQVIKEINAHKIPYSSFKDFFNFKEKESVEFHLFIKDSTNKPSKLMSLRASTYHANQHIHRDSEDGLYSLVKELKIKTKDALISNIDLVYTSKDGKKSVFKDCYVERDSLDRLSSFYN